MKRLLIVFLVFTVIPILAQSPVDKLSNRLKAKIENESQNSQHLVWIYFTDKGNDNQKYFSNPETVVSRKSLDRRAKVLSKTALIDFSDIPVNEIYMNELVNAGIELKK